MWSDLTDVTRERISRILELSEILSQSNQTGFDHVNAAVFCTISGLEPSLVITEPRYLKLVTV